VTRSSITLLSTIDPKLSAGFARFAVSTVERKKTFVLTHSAELLDSSSRTSETADAPIRALGGGAVVTQLDSGD